MPLVETEALVLKSYNLAEADKIVVFLTRGEGVVRGVAKGAKRLKSKFGSSLEPFSVVKLEYFFKESSELVAIQKVELTRSSFASASEPEFLQVFSYLSELLILFSPPHDPNETLYRMVKACIESAVNDADGLASIAVYFEIWLLRLAGFLPDWSSCERCSRAFDQVEETYLSHDLNLTCDSCRAAANRIVVDAENRDIIASARRLGPTDFVRTTHGRVERSSYLSDIMKRLLSRAAGKDIAAERSLAIKFN